MCNLGFVALSLQVTETIKMSGRDLKLTCTFTDLSQLAETAMSELSIYHRQETPVDN